jgi:hypothetical protein
VHRAADAARQAVEADRTALTGQQQEHARAVQAPAARKRDLDAGFAKLLRKQADLAAWEKRAGEWFTAQQSEHDTCAAALEAREDRLAAREPAIEAASADAMDRLRNSRPQVRLGP